MTPTDHLATILAPHRKPRLATFCGRRADFTVCEFERELRVGVCDGIGVLVFEEEA